MIRNTITPKSKTNNKRFLTVTFETRKRPFTPYLGLFHFMPEIGQVERCSSEGIKKESLHNAGFLFNQDF
ncbi:V sporulation protein D [Bacillus subtilis]|nr:V sporulation protein D [Bacillus subtilis]